MPVPRIAATLLAAPLLCCVSYSPDGGPSPAFAHRVRRPAPVAPRLLPTPPYPRGVASRGEPTVLVFWDAEQAEANRVWLPAFGNLSRVAAPLGLAVLGLPRYPSLARLERACRELAVDWAQLVSSEETRGWESALGVRATPTVVLTRGPGSVVYSGPPGDLANELMALLSTFPYQDVHLHHRIVVPEVPALLTFAGSAFRVPDCAEVSFSFGDLLVWTISHYPEVERGSGPGEYRWREVPEGALRLTVTVRLAAPAGSPSTSDWHAVVRVGIPATGEQAPVAIALRRPLTLTRPALTPGLEDRAGSEARTDRWPAGQPVRFAWSAIPEATEYAYVLRRLALESIAGNPSPHAAGTTRGLELDLGALPPGTYSFALEARRSGLVVGSFAPSRFRPGADGGDYITYVFAVTAPGGALVEG